MIRSHGRQLAETQASYDAGARQTLSGLAGSAPFGSSLLRRSCQDSVFNTFVAV